MKLCKLGVENTNDLGKRIVWLACLAERLRCIVNLLNHLCEILVELVEAVLKLLGKLVTMGSLVVS